MQTLLTDDDDGGDGGGTRPEMPGTTTSVNNQNGSMIMGQSTLPTVTTIPTITAVDMLPSTTGKQITDDKTMTTMNSTITIGTIPTTNIITTAINKNVQIITITTPSIRIGGINTIGKSTTAKKKMDGRTRPTKRLKLSQITTTTEMITEQVFGTMNRAKSGKMMAPCRANFTEEYIITDEDLMSLNETEKDRLRKLCWETMFGQELVKLTVMDFVLTVISTLISDFIRALIVRLVVDCFFLKFIIYKFCFLIPSDIATAVPVSVGIWRKVFPVMVILKLPKTFFIW